MNLNSRVKVFIQLGKTLNLFANNQDWPGYECGLSQDEFSAFNELIERAKHYNGWFTEESVRKALSGISHMLESESLKTWVQKYTCSTNQATVGIIMAGNIPFVGFHDLMCVLIAGHKAKIKFASDDDVLMPAMVDLIKKLDAQLGDLISISDRKLEGFDAVIATGSNNSARYFESYFGHVPNIIRKNRTSCAIISGLESKEELAKLGDDIFTHYGLGCRNVSKIFIPHDYKLDTFFEGIYAYKDIINHHKYANNYDYNRAVYLMNQEPILDNGFVLLREDKSMFSPLAVVFYERYKDNQYIKNRLEEERYYVQCIVGNQYVPFGKAQQPEIDDYADGVDTMKFLCEI